MLNDSNGQSSVKRVDQGRLYNGHRAQQDRFPGPMTVHAVARRAEYKL